MKHVDLKNTFGFGLRAFWHRRTLLEVLNLVSILKFIAVAEAGRVSTAAAEEAASGVSWGERAAARTAGVSGTCARRFSGLPSLFRFSRMFFFL